MCHQRCAGQSTSSDCFTECLEDTACKGMTVDCIDCIETCAAAKTVVEDANDRSLFDVPKLKAHFTASFIEVRLWLIWLISLYKTIGAWHYRSKCARYRSLPRRKRREEEKERGRKEKEEKRTPQEQESRLGRQENGQQAATKVQSQAKKSIKFIFIKTAFFLGLRFYRKWNQSL